MVALPTILPGTQPACCLEPAARFTEPAKAPAVVPKLSFDRLPQSPRQSFLSDDGGLLRSPRVVPSSVASRATTTTASTPPSRGAASNSFPRRDCTQSSGQEASVLTVCSGSEHSDGESPARSTPSITPDGEPLRKHAIVPKLALADLQPMVRTAESASSDAENSKRRALIPKLCLTGLRPSLQGCTALGAPPPEQQLYELLSAGSSDKTVTDSEGSSRESSGRVSRENSAKDPALGSYAERRSLFEEQPKRPVVVPKLSFRSLRHSPRGLRHSPRSFRSPLSSPGGTIPEEEPVDEQPRSSHLDSSSKESPLGSQASSASVARRRKPYVPKLQLGGAHSSLQGALLIGAPPPEQPVTPRVQMRQIVGKSSLSPHSDRCKSSLSPHADPTSPIRAYPSEKGAVPPTSGSPRQHIDSVWPPPAILANGKAPSFSSSSEDSAPTGSIEIQATKVCPKQLCVGAETSDAAISAMGGTGPGRPNGGEVGTGPGRPDGGKVGSRAVLHQKEVSLLSNEKCPLLYMILRCPPFSCLC